MKILFIQPKLNIKTNFLNRAIQIIQAEQFYYLHLCVYYLVSITPLKHSIKIIDERFGKVKIDEDYDLFVITCSTPYAPRAYEIADNLRDKGKIVVLGGPHSSLMPEEAKEHADSVLVGEVDVIWPVLLDDFQRGELKPIYKQKGPVEPRHIKKIRMNDGNKIFFPTRVEAGRGCPNCCEFCLVQRIVGSSHRLRPVADVIAEIKLTKSKFINFDDSSLTIDLDYTKKLFRELAPLHKKFFGCGNVDVLSRDDELLKLACKAGFIAWFVGFESFSDKTLKNVGKKTNSVAQYKSVVEKLHENKMAVMGSFMFGFDTDDPDVFDKILDDVMGLGVDSADFNILGIYPGTSLFVQFEKEGRILTKDWSKYNFGQVVFKPKNMTKEFLEAEAWRISKEFYSIKNILKLSIKSAKLGFYPFMVVTIKNVSLRRFYRSWKILYK